MTPARSGRLSESLERVEAALARLWEPDATGTAKARAYTVNLIAVGHEPRFVALVHDVALRLSARTFVISVDPRLEPWALEGDVSAVCQIGEREVCAERIELTFGAVAAKRAHSVVEALAESRLRTVMLVGNGASASVVDGLAPDCARVVVDSAGLGVARTARIAELTLGELGDLAFVRGRRWREMLARLFDDPAVRAGSIRALDIAHVEVEDHPGATAEADLLLGWLGSRLGWRASLAGIRDADGKPVEVRLSVARRDDVIPGCVESVAIHADVSDGRLVARVTRDTDAQHLWCEVQTPAGTQARRHYAIPHREPAEEVARALGDAAGETLLRDALAFAAAWRGFA